MRSASLGTCLVSLFCIVAGTAFADYSPFPAYPLFSSWFFHDSVSVFQWGSNVVRVTKTSRETLYDAGSLGPSLVSILPMSGGGYLGRRGSSVYSSSDLLNWSVCSTDGNTKYLRALSETPNGFIAVGDSGTILSSVNGYNWRQQSSGSTRNLSTIISSCGKVFVFGDSSTALVSDNGVVWSSVDFGAKKKCVGYAGCDSAIVVVSDSGMFSSVNGVTWAWVPIDTPWVFNGIARSDSLFAALAVAAPNNDDNDFEARVYTSKDGISWEQRIPIITQTTGKTVDFRSTIEGGIQWDGSQFFAYSYDAKCCSPNGINWTIFIEWEPYGYTKTIPGSRNGSYLWERYFEGDGPIHPWTRQYGSEKYPLPYVPADICVDGIIQDSLRIPLMCRFWYYNQPSIRALTSSQQLVIASTANGLITAGGVGSIKISTDGAEWNQLPSVTNSTLRCVVSSDTLLLAGGDNGVLITSSNNEPWKRRNSGVSTTLRAGTCFKGLYVMGGDSGTLISSRNGGGWTKRSTGTTMPICAFANNDSIAIAVVQGPDENVWDWKYAGCLISRNGTDWQLHEFGSETHPDTSFCSVVWTGRYFAALSRNFSYSDTQQEAIYLSADGESWTKIYNASVKRRAVKILAVNDTVVSILHDNGHFSDHWLPSTGVPVLPVVPPQNNRVLFSQAPGFLQFRIQEVGIANEVHIQLFDLAGRNLKTVTCEQMQADVQVPINELAAGCYVFKVSSPHLNQTGQFVISR